MKFEITPHGGVKVSTDGTNAAELIALGRISGFAGENTVDGGDVKFVILKPDYVVAALAQLRR